MLNYTVIKKSVVPPAFTYEIDNNGRCIYTHPNTYTTNKSAVRGAVNKLKTFRPEEVAPVVEVAPVAPVIEVAPVVEVEPVKVETEKKTPVATKKARTMKFNFYHDPAHGWLNVNRDLLVKLGIDKDISEHSYQRKGSVYLEEDRDMSLLIQTLKANGIEPVIAEWATSRKSKIRGYTSYRPHMDTSELENRCK